MEKKTLNQIDYILIRKTLEPIADLTISECEACAPAVAAKEMTQNEIWERTKEATLPGNSHQQATHASAEEETVSLDNSIDAQTYLERRSMKQSDSNTKQCCQIGVP